MLDSEKNTEKSTQPHPRSISGLAKKYGLCRGTLYNEIRRGKLEITKIGSRSIVTPDQEAAWLARSQQQEA